MRIFLTILIFVTGVHANIFTNKEQSDAAAYMDALKDLIVSTQRTRGVTSAYLNGNHSAIVVIYSYREDMKKAIGKMESLPLSSDPIISNRATALSLSLIKLNQEALEITPKESFDRHCENISQALMLAQTVSKKGFQNLNAFSKNTSGIMLETILPLSESLGQLRAFGSGIAAKKNITKNDNYKVEALLQEIKSLSAKLHEELTATAHQYKNKYNVNLNTELLKVENIIKTFSKFTRKELITKNISIDSMTYFNEGTNTVDSVIRLFDINSKAIASDSKGWF
ncbi:MAG: hypothetical protein L3J10_06825 [Sulfurimonas sp.]|nr:hypothetical protein [Sulfurimonas sp.]